MVSRTDLTRSSGMVSIRLGRADGRGNQTRRRGDGAFGIGGVEKPYLHRRPPRKKRALRRRDDALLDLRNGAVTISLG